MLNGANNVITDLFEWDPTEPVATRPLYWQSRTAEGNYLLFYTHDGNKNVGEAVFYQRARGVAAHYEYAPFGEVTAQTRGNAWGAFCLSSLNPWRFSSEYAEDDTATVYYNYRHYGMRLGRWMGRDPVHEVGGLNLYALCDNNELVYVDGKGEGKIGLAIRVGRWGIRIIRKITKDEAKRLYRKEGSDICGSKQVIKRMSKRKGMDIQGPEVHSDHFGMGNEHYHMPGKKRRTVTGARGGHGFVKNLTAVGLFGDHWYTEAVDLVNPISDINDILDIIDPDVNEIEVDVECEEECQCD